MPYVPETYPQPYVHQQSNPLRATTTHGEAVSTDGRGIAWRRSAHAYISDLGYTLVPAHNTQDLVCGWELWWFTGGAGLFILSAATVTSCMRAAEIHRVHWTMGTEYDR